MDKPKIVVLCGSSKFVDIMAVCAWLIERDEKAITIGLHLLPQWYCKDLVSDYLAETEGVAEQMDQLHLRKIDIAGEVFVVNFEDYVGYSTRNEILYARANNKLIRWYSHDPIGKRVQNLMNAERTKNE